MEHRIAIFHDRYPLLGPIVWLLSLQYYITQVVVAQAWKTPFSVLTNTISDLANTTCGPYGTKYVCSPLHNYMNASFITLGVFMIAGSVLIYQEFRRTPGSAAGFACMGLAGVGTTLVGLAPENIIAQLHVVGAALPFFFGNLAMVILGTVLKLPKSLKLLPIGFGLLGLSALGLYLTHTYGPLHQGGLERVVAYPQSIWMILFGAYMSRNHYIRHRQRTHTSNA